MGKQAVFLDKDGTLVENVPYNVDPDRIRLCPRAVAGLSLLHQADLPLIIISNQSGVAMGRFREEDLAAVEGRVRELLEEADIPLTGFHYCPHHPRGSVPEYAKSCSCRKPRPGLLLRAAEEHGLDLAVSWFVGDILDDVEAGHRAGCRTVLIDHGSETEWRLTPLRLPDYLALDLFDAAHQVLAADPAPGPIAAGTMHPGGYR